MNGAYLRELEAAGLVGVQRSKVAGSNLDAPSIYTLLPVGVGSDTPLCSSDTPLCNGGVAPSFADNSEESEKKVREEEDEEGAQAVAASPSAGADPSALQAPAAVKPEKKPKKPQLEFPDPPPELAAAPGFIERWGEFQRHRRAIRKPLTPMAAKLLLPKLAQRPAQAVAALEMAIENSWQGFEWDWFDDRLAARSRSGDQRPRAFTGQRTNANPSSAPLPEDWEEFKRALLRVYPAKAQKIACWRSWEAAERDLQPVHSEYRRWRENQREKAVVA